MDKEVVGAGFYVMEFLEGRVFQNIFMKEVSDEDRRAWYVCFSFLRSTSFLLHLNTSDKQQRTNHNSWKSTIKTLTNLSSIPLSSLSIPPSFAPLPDSKPYFPRQVNSLLKVSEAQSKAKTKEGKETGEIWGTKELRPFFQQGAERIARDEVERGVGGVVHGDFKMDNLVSPLVLHQILSPPHVSRLQFSVLALAT
jgi:aminoglycoside phosphotransferase (APT) family kinase protein